MPLLSFSEQFESGVIIDLLEVLRTREGIRNAFVFWSYKCLNTTDREVKCLARFFILWRMNPAAPWPTDPSKGLELNEMMWMAIDRFKQEGMLEEFGFFPEGTSGYAIGKGDSIEVFSRLNMFIPYMLAEVHEIIPYEKGKEALRKVLSQMATLLK